VDPSFVNDVNAEQREAITHGPGPLLVVAGAGSGKTRVITRRVAWLLEQGIPPWQVVALTFTNKAAREMRERVEALVPASELWVCTFHSFAARTLRRFGERIGYTREFTIYDTEDQLALIKEILKDKRLNEDLRPSEVSNHISRWKNGLGGGDVAGYRAERLEMVANVYEQRMRESNAMDFDDLLLNLLKVLEQDAEARDRLRLRCKWLLVDEYQDTNTVQYRILRELSQPDFNVCATGDPDQSIYRWRGATIRNILAFEEDFEGARVITLDRNYRSTKTILAVANAVIRHNRDRYEKDLRTERDQGTVVREVRCLEATEEARSVARETLAWIGRGRSPRDIAVFYRVNAQSRLLEQAMLEQGIPYCLVGTVAFYKRREVKDLLAYVRAVRNPDDAVSFWRIFNVPPRKLGKKAAETVRDAAFERGISPREFMRDRAALEAMGRPRKALVAMAAILDKIEALPGEDPAQFIEGVLEASDYRHYLGQGTPAEETDRLENVMELVSAAAEFARREPDGGVDGFLEENALVSDQDTYEESLDKVTLMTVHSAKGLEFPCVIVTGLEEELFPHALSMQSDVEIEEERRLFYVAVTRAMDELTLSHARHRMRAGVPLPCLPSRFLQEIPAEYVAVDDQAFDPFAVKDDEPVFQLDDDEENGSGWQAGDRVRHHHFGEGTVVAVRQSAGTTRVTVEFNEAGRRELSLEYARLERL
jgi:DNA helicase-2/ATP-dependent DNA helicase PcrA